MKESTEQKLAELERRLFEAESTLDAIRRGQIDAVVVHGQKVSKIYTLKGVDFTYRVLIERMNEGAAILSKEGLILYANKKLADIIGQKRNRIVGTYLKEYLLSSELKKLNELIKTGVDKSISKKILFSNPDGMLRSLLFSVNPMPQDTGGDLGLVVADISDVEEKEKLQKLQTKLEEIVIDRTRKLQRAHKELEIINKKLLDEIEDHKQTEQRLVESQNRLYIAQRIARMSFIEWDLQSDTVYCSDEIYHLLGLPQNDVFKIDELYAVVHPEDLDALQNEIQLVIENKKRLNIDFRIIRSDDSVLWVNAQAELIKNKRGKPLKLLSTLIDISERKQYEEQLTQKEREFTLLLNSAAEGIFGMDVSGYCTFVNRRCLELLGFKDEKDVLGLNIHEIINHEREGGKSSSKARCRLQKTLKKGVGIHVNDEVFRRKDGSYFPVEYWSYPLKRGNRVIGAVVTFFDVSEKRAVEKQMLRMINVLEQSLESIIITDLEAKIIYVNPAFEKITGYKKDEVIGKKPNVLKSGMHDEKYYQKLWDRLSNGDSWEGTFVNRRKNGDLFKERTVIFPIKDARGNIINYAAVKRDITEEELLREQMFQAQKLESLGKLTGGVAHDFNNLLTVINGYAQMGLQLIGKDHPLFSYLDQIARAGERASHLTSQLLTFSRKQIISPKVVNVNNIIKDTEKMLRRLIGEDIEIITELDENALPIKADVTQIEQILMNLVVNARDAIIEKNDPREKRITLVTKQLNLDKEFASKYIDYQEGPNILIQVNDTGIGMTPEIQRHIFEPFFTTKEQGKGTGLGLSTVYGIVKQNNAAIYVESEQGKGTTFSIYWPCAAPEQENEKSDKAKIIKGSNQRILIVEDDEGVRRFLTESIKKLNYDVLQAENGKRAIEIILEGKEKVDLIITDLVMPGMSGIELAKELKELNIKIPILFSTGYADEHIDYLISNDIKTDLIQKPYSIDELAEKLDSFLK